VKRAKALTQANAIQDVVTAKLLELKDASARESGATVAQLARAWDILEERKRILRGQPLPGSYKPKAKPKPRPKALATDDCP
jgi:hypothetical protein